MNNTLTEVWIRNYRGEDVYKTLMPNVPRVGDVIHDAPDDLLVHRVEWFEYSKRHEWVAQIYTMRVE